MYHLADTSFLDVDHADHADMRSVKHPLHCLCNENRARKIHEQVGSFDTFGLKRLAQTSRTWALGPDAGARLCAQAAWLEFEVVFVMFF